MKWEEELLRKPKVTQKKEKLQLHVKNIDKFLISST